MIPQLAVGLLGWTIPVQLRVVSTTAVDFEPVEQVLDVVWFDASMQALSPKAVNRKPEGERIWKWWEAWTTKKIADDSVVQDQDGTQYRVRSSTDWSQAGFYHYEMTEQPKPKPEPTEAA